MGCNQTKPVLSNATYFRATAGPGLRAEYEERVRRKYNPDAKPRRDLESVGLHIGKSTKRDKYGRQRNAFVYIRPQNERRGGEMGSGWREGLVVVVVVVVVMVKRLSILLTREDRCWVEVEGNPRLPLVLEVVSERLHMDLMLERHRLLPVLVNIMEPRIVILSVR